MLTRRLIYIATFVLFSNIVSAQLGVKFEKVDDPSTIQRLPEASEEQKAKCSDVTTSFRVRGFILPLSANKYEFEYNWNNNPIRFINAGGIIVDKHGKLYSVDKEGNLINHNGVIVDFSGIIMDDYYSIRKFFYWIESSPSYIIWWSIIIICLYHAIIATLKKIRTKYKIITVKANKQDS